MISTENPPLNHETSDTDFTTAHYTEVVKMATRNYKVVTYDNIAWSERFVLWRHDMDYSLNRGLDLARIEHEYGIRATYFINPHSEFYNIAEKKQHSIIKEILGLGHKLGLHFDAAFFDVESETELDSLIKKETEYLEWLFDVKPIAFSFHNPTKSNLSCEEDSYGGLINCYSRRFKKEVAYCSDSNGYWRFRRLYDVLNDAEDRCLQVLTHPGWWQVEPMPPRQRIFRSVYGRASATMKLYDKSLEQHNRLNHTDNIRIYEIFNSINPDKLELCDYLWNKRHFDTLYLELWYLYHRLFSSLILSEDRIIDSMESLQSDFDKYLDMYNLLLSDKNKLDIEQLEKYCHEISSSIELNLTSLKYSCNQ